MATTIHTLAYKLTVDSKEFEKGTTASRKELALAKREMRAMLTPAEKMEHSLQQLGELAKKDARFQELYNRKLAQYQAHLKKTAAKTSMLEKVSFRAKLALAGMATAFVGLATSGAVRQFFANVERFDAMTKSAEKLGISIENLTRLQFVAGQTSGLSPEQVEKAVGMMVKKISEASVGKGTETIAVIESLGLSLKELNEATPDQQFVMIARAMDNVENSADRVRIANEFFGRSLAGMHTTLQLTNEEFAELANRSDEIGNTLNGLDSAKIAEVNDQVTELKLAWQGLTTELTTNFAPAITVATKSLTDMLKVRELAVAALPAAVKPFARNVIDAALPKDRDLGPEFGAETDEPKAESLAERMAKIEAEKQAKITEEKERQDALAERTAKREALRNKLTAESLSMVMSVQTAEEKRQRAIQEANKFQYLGLIDENTRLRLINKADSDLKASLIGRINKANSGLDKKTTGVERFNIGPADSISAGSSAAFAERYKVAATRDVEIELSKKSVDLQKLSLRELQKIAEQSDHDKPRARGLERI